jgi:hypothetical protein
MGTGAPTPCGRFSKRMPLNEKFIVNGKLTERTFIEHGVTKDMLLVEE